MPVMYGERARLCQTSDDLRQEVVRARRSSRSDSIVALSMCVIMVFVYYRVVYMLGHNIEVMTDPWMRVDGRRLRG